MNVCSATPRPGGKATRYDYNGRYKTPSIHPQKYVKGAGIACVLLFFGVSIRMIHTYPKARSIAYSII